MKQLKKSASNMKSQDVIEIRLKLGLTVDHFAEAMGVTRQAVVYWETGERKIPKGTGMLMQVFYEYPLLIGRYE